MVMIVVMIVFGVSLRAAPLWAAANAAPPPSAAMNDTGNDNERTQKGQKKAFYPCPHRKDIRFSHELNPGLSETETRLVCGDIDAWKDIPRNQSEYSIKNFLQDRALYHARFYADPKDDTGKSMYVDLGEPTRVTSVTADGAPESLKIWKKRKVVGALLTPKILGDVEHWVFAQLQSFGYACPEVHSEANYDDGKLRVHIKSGPLQNLVSVEEQAIEGIQNGAYQRFDAFELNQPYNGQWMNVTENRLTSSGQVESAHFISKCEADGVHSKESLVAGPPRLLILGAGIDTEGVVQARASWRNTRLGPEASLVDFTALVSALTQRIDITVDYFLLHYPSRWSLRPSFDLIHENEQYYQTIETVTQVGAAKTWDNQDLGGSFDFGPAYEPVHTISGFGPQFSQFLGLAMQYRVRRHDFEFYQQSPRSGYNVEGSLAFADKALVSSATAQRFGVRGEALFNFRGFDPPLLVFGVRGGYYTIFTPERPGPGNNIPPNLMNYLGGSANLRGWGRQELPLSGYGALTTVYGGFETRLVSTLPFGLDPFLFNDVGAFGDKGGITDSPLFWSPGLGIRWQSPIGAFRTTFAHGYPAGHFQFYLSFGEEF